MQGIVFKQKPVILMMHIKTMEKNLWRSSKSTKNWTIFLMVLNLFVAVSDLVEKV